MNTLKKVILILLTIFIITPLIFLGTCIPIAVGVSGVSSFFSLFYLYSFSNLLLFPAIIFWIFISIWLIVKIYKSISKEEPSASEVAQINNVLESNSDERGIQD